MNEPELIKIYENDPPLGIGHTFVIFNNLTANDYILGFQKDFKAVDIRRIDGVWRPDFDMIDYYLIAF